jgi:flavin reductase (DIM6/NTAB) family NADH-FMN oxidoreductase RutF
VSSPAIGEALARLECVIRQVVELGEPGVPFGEVHLVIAEVVWVQYDASILNERGRIDPLLLTPVARLGLRSFLRTVPEGVLNLPRVAWDEHVAGTEGR